jgi:rod shape-determining protein MreC
MRFIYTKTFLRIFAVFILLALLVVLDARGYIGRVKSGFIGIYGYSTTKLAAGTNLVKDSFKTLFIIRKLVKENANLNSEVNQLVFENARLKSAQDENSALRRELNFRQQSNFSVMPVEVLISDPTGFSQTIVIDKGADHGIKLNQPIVAQPGLLVGKVSKVYAKTSEVTLITDPSIVYQW